MNQFESIQRQLAEIQEQLDQCATKEDIKEFKDTISKELKPITVKTNISADDGYVVWNMNEDMPRIQEQLKEELQRNKHLFNAASLNVSLGNKEDLVAMCRYENGELKINNAMIGDLNAAFIEANALPTTHVQPGISFNALVAASIKDKQAFRKEANEKLKQSVQQEIDDKAFAEALSKTIISLMKRLRK